MGYFDPVSDPFTTVPLSFTAAPVQDSNIGWLGQYGSRFHYPTVLEFFKYLALTGLPRLTEAGRLYYFGDTPDYSWTLTLEEKVGYETVPCLRFAINGQERLFRSTVNQGGWATIIPHTKAWLQTAYEWFLERVPDDSRRFPSWTGFLGEPEPINLPPPGDMGENEFESHSSESSSSSESGSSGG